LPARNDIFAVPPPLSSAVGGPEETSKGDGFRYVQAFDGVFKDLMWVLDDLGCNRSRGLELFEILWNPESVLIFCNHGWEGLWRFVHEKGWCGVSSSRSLDHPTQLRGIWGAQRP
jgi:hypothetical protein